jgi:hypothetical protein
MKKVFYFIALLFLISASWIQADGASYTYDADAGMITSAEQFSANSIEINDGGGFAALIDGTTQWFHSGYNTSNGSTLPNADHYLQVDISSSPAQQIIFVFTGRAGANHDSWDDVDIYCTNDTSAHDSWKLVKSLTDMLNGDESGAHYVSPMIDLGAVYSYVRFVVKKTTSLRQDGTYSRYFWNLDEFQMYKAIEVKDPQTMLKTVVDSISLLNLNFPIGTNPGYYPQEKFDAYTAAYNSAETAINESHTDAEYLTMIATLRNTLKDLNGSKIPMSDGYYNFVNAFPGYLTTQKVEKGMGVNVHSQLNWGDANTKDPMQLFKVTAVTDTSYTIQSAATGEYVNTVVGTSKHIPMTKTPVTPQMFRSLAKAQWNIFNLYNTQAYHTEGHQSGAGKSGLIVTWQDGVDGASAWYLRKVLDQTLIDSLIQAAPQAYASVALKEAVAVAKAARAKNDEYDPMITNAKDADAGCQISSNAKEPNEGSYANLIDGSTSTFFHSIWSAAGPTTAHNLQIDLVNATDKFYFTFTGRSGDYHDNPNDINVYVTNDETLGKDAASADDQWTAVDHLTNGFPANTSAATYKSPMFTLTQAYRFVRLVVNHTTSEASGRVNGTTNLPYFNLSEFQVYNGNPSAKAEYNTVAGMKDACDKVDALVKAAEASIASNTAVAADTAAIYDAVKLMNSLYVNRDSLDAVMATLIDSCNTIYANVMRSTEGLIIEAGQLSANSVESGDGGGLAALIDGNKTTFCHSGYDENSQPTLPDAEHYLQVALKVPVQKFFISLVGRSGAHDTPDSVTVWATNDPTNEDSWTKIVILPDLINGDPNAPELTTPELDMGAAYTNVRFVVNRTTSQRQEGTHNRYFWNLAEFQMYQNLPDSRIQYNYIEGMKTAADALKAATETASQLGKHMILTSDPINTLRAALSPVLALYADSTQLSSLFAKYISAADSSVVGDGIGFVNAQTAIDEFRTAINEAKSTVSPTQPTAPALKAATDKMNTAFATFMTHVGQIVPNQWYNIVSGSYLDYAKNQPMFLSSTSTGNKVSIGGYPIDKINIASDPYAVWRFVPIEGKEGQYAIQSLGTGQYLGAYRGDGSDNASLMSHKKAPYKLMYGGNGKFKIIQVSLKNELDALKSDQTNKIVLNWPYNGGNQQAWKFEAVSSDQEMSFNVMPNNSIQIMTLPFEMKGDLSLSKVNEGVVTYGIKYVKVDATGTHLGLKVKDDFEAGEPFIMTVNDYTLYDAAAESYPIAFSLPTTVADTSAIVPNGLVGTLEGTSVSKAGLGIFSASKLTVTTASSVGISGRSGYINPNLVVNEEGDADLIIDITELMTGVKQIVASKEAGNVNVYSIDGKLLKKNVKAAEAGKNLNKGIYIIGKKKVAIK